MEFSRADLVPNPFTGVPARPEDVSGVVTRLERVVTEKPKDEILLGQTFSHGYNTIKGVQRLKDSYKFLRWVVDEASGTGT